MRCFPSRVVVEACADAARRQDQCIAKMPLAQCRPHLIEQRAGPEDRLQTTVNLEASLTLPDRQQQQYSAVSLAVSHGPLSVEKLRDVVDRLTLERTQRHQCKLNARRLFHLRAVA